MPAPALPEHGKDAATKVPVAPTEAGPAALTVMEGLWVGPAVMPGCDPCSVLAD